MLIHSTFSIRKLHFKNRRLGQSKVFYLLGRKMRVYIWQAGKKEGGGDLYSNKAVLTVPFVTWPQLCVHQNKQSLSTE